MPIYVHAVPAALHVTVRGWAWALKVFDCTIRLSAGMRAAIREEPSGNRECKTTPRSIHILTFSAIREIKLCGVEFESAKVDGSGCGKRRTIAEL
uniref:Uncharacterized protein n=1 Tax=Pristionchus pacificus TaxID=54126 RepID=A0A2A6C6F8_PRIPA|eukprot:PDM73697.1 hypothetical protein PRIPAC_41053 [Pristionchus pacificus]